MASIIKAFMALALFVTLSFSLTILEPGKREISNGGELDLGAIGPGQTVSIIIDGRPTTGGIYGLGGAYDLANVTSMPSGWRAQQSDPTGNPLQVKLTSPKFAPEGGYAAQVGVFDEGDKEKLGNVSFTVKMRITHDVLDASLDSGEKGAMSGQPVGFFVNLRNKANTGDVFVVSSSNIKGYEFKRYVYVPAQSEKSVFYEMVAGEAEQYRPEISVVSDSSPLINATLNAIVDVRPSVPTDYKATNNGMLFFPVMNGILYSIAGLISNLF